MTETTQENNKAKFGTDIFDKMLSVDDEVWFEKNQIINTKGNEKSSRLAVRYQAGRDIFPREFGIGKTRKFVALLKTFQELNFEFKDEFILVTDGAGSCLSYRIPGEGNFADKKESIANAKIVLDASVGKISEGLLHFDLNKELLSKIKTSGRTIQEVDTVSTLSLEKQASTEALTLTVRNVDSEHTTSWNVGINNNGQILDFSAKLNIDNLPDGDWDAYLFKSSETVEIGGRNIGIVWMYLKAKKEPIDAIVVFNK